MKNGFYFMITCLVLLCGSCLKDDTNEDYRQLVKPVLLNEEKLPELFVENHVYSVKYGEELIITPEISYPDLSDLEYEWRINGQTVGREKDLHWVCQIDERAVGTYIIRRKRAGNAEVYAFSVDLNRPYERGWAVLAEETGGLRLHFLQEIVATPEYEFVEWKDAAGRLLQAGHPLRLMEFWSTEAASVKGELLYLDEYPEKCVNLDGSSLGETLALREEFREETFPEGLKIKDALYCGFVSYLLAANGKLYQRRAGSGYYTGRFSDEPVRFKGKELTVSFLIPCVYSSKAALLFDSGESRFLLVETDYEVSAAGGKGHKAGNILEFDDASGLNHLSGQEVVWGSFIKPFYSFETDYSFFCILKTASGAYRARQFVLEYDGEVLSGVEKVYTDVPFEDFGEGSRICVLNDEYMGMIQPCIYYTRPDDAYTLYCRKRTSTGLSAPVVYKRFDHPVVALQHGKLSRTSAYLGVALDNGEVMIFNLSKNYTEEVETSLVKTWQGLGKVIGLYYKYGNLGNV